MHHWRLIWSVALIGGCAVEPDGPVVDASAPDAAGDAAPDVERPEDRGLPDAAVPDTAVPDAAVPDAAPDAAGPDAATPDAGGPPGDAGPDCAPEQCNGLDDDCDGRVDEGFNLGDACMAGVGACAVEGQRECAPNGQVRCDVAPGPAADEICDDVDNDCDGRTDEGVRNACGACGPPPPELCNLRDDDCDGVVDEAVPADACALGVGACVRAGALRCDRGRVSCDAGLPIPPGAERCGDAVDNDCDGQVDESALRCAEQIGRCAVPRDAICDGGDFRCPDPQVDPPIPPECELGPGNPPRTLIAADVVDFWALPPNANDPHAAILWPANGTRIQRVSVDAQAVGEPALAPVSLQSVTRAGADFAGIEADAIGYRWVRFNAAGEILARADHFYARDAEVWQAIDQLPGADLVEQADGGFVVAFAAWGLDRLGLYTAHLDAAGALVELRDLGGVAEPPALSQTPVGPIISTTTRNGVGWRGPQYGRLPKVGEYGVALPDRTIPLGVRTGIVGWLRAAGTSDDALLYWRPGDGQRGICLRRLGGDATHCHARDRFPDGRVVWRGADGLLGWFETPPNNDGVGVRVQPIDADGAKIDRHRWIATRIDQPRTLRMVATPGGVLTLWSAAGGLFAQAGLDLVDVGDGPLCPAGQRALPADGACDGPEGCVDPEACVPAGPVCGCDGEDYPDRCAAIARAVGVWRQGPCPVDRQACPDGVSDRWSDDDRCRPCTAIQPACGWRGERSSGQVYRDACEAIAADPRNTWSQGNCDEPNPEPCREETCIQVCPICGVDGECYAEVDVWGESACF